MEHKRRQLYSCFQREFPICDIAQGQIGDTPILSEGNPPVWDCYCIKKIMKCISYIKEPMIPYFSLKFDLMYVGLSHKGIPFYFQGIPPLMTMKWVIFLRF